MKQLLLNLRTPFIGIMVTCLFGSCGQIVMKSQEHNSYPYKTYQLIN